MKPTFNDIRKHYLKEAAYPCAAIFIAFGLALIFNALYPFNEKLIQFLQAVSYVPVGIMLYERLNIRSWSGKTPIEEYDQQLFNKIAFTSIFFTVFTITLRP